MARILIIDDDSNICTLLSDVFTEMKHTVMTAQRGMQGLEMASENGPDIIILDIGMPDLNGYEVCSSLRSRPETRATPVLMLTGTTDLPGAMKGLASGADDYITKPFDADEVAWRVQILLGKGR